MHTTLFSLVSWKCSSDQRTVTENDSCVLSASQFCWDVSKMKTQEKQAVMITECFGTTAEKLLSFPYFSVNSLSRTSVTEIGSQVRADL